MSQLASGNPDRRPDQRSPAATLLAGLSATWANSQACVPTGAVLIDPSQGLSPTLKAVLDRR
jgi:hypothetical protein